MGNKTREERTAIIKYLRKNYCASLKETARHFKLNKSTISKRLRENLGMSFLDFRRFFFGRALVKYARKHPHATLRESADHFGVGITFIRNHLNNNGIQRKKRVQVVTDTIRSDYIESNQSANLKEIAGHFSVSTTTIRKLIKKFKIPYCPKNKKINTTALADYIKEHPEATLSKIAGHFKVTDEAIRRRIQAARLPYKCKIIYRKFSKDQFARYTADNPSATYEELAKYFNVSIATVKRCKRNCRSLVSEIYLARYVTKHPGVKWQTLKKHFPGISIKKCFSDGVPREWTKEVVEKLLDEWVLQFGDELIPSLLAEKARYLNRTFYKFELYRKYPLHYWRFDSLIYPLFGMDMPKNYEEELQMQWSPQEILHKRYRKLLKLHHPDRHYNNSQTAKIVHFKFRWVVKAYHHLLKRREKLTLGEPPHWPSNKYLSNNGKRIASS